MNILSARILLTVLFIFLLSSLRKSAAQTMHYQLVDVELKRNQNEPNFLDSLGWFTQPVNFFLNGIQFTSKNKKISFGNEGLWSTIPVYNFVDGFWIGQTLKGKVNFNEKHKLELEAMIYYTTARKALTWQTDLSYSYLPSLVGKLKVLGGDITSDYDAEEHLARLENSLYSLGVGRNYMKLYRKRFVELQNSFYPLSGLRIYNSFSVQWRESMENNITYSFIKPEKNFNQDNIPDNRDFRLMPDNLALVGSAGFDYTVCQACVYHPFTNEIIYSYIPTISARIVFGIPAGGAHQSSFQYVEGSLNQRFKFSDKNTIDYKIGGGTFLNENNLWFPDFKHFGAYSLPSMRTFSDDGYFLIGYYKADTKRNWVKGSANYMSEHFLLTRIRKLAKEKFSEGIHARYLWTPVIRHYTEVGYSFGYDDYIRVGCFVGFTGSKYNSVGFTLSFPWLTGGY